MGYIDNNLLEDEQIMFRTKKHIIIFLAPLICTVFAMFATPYMRANNILIHFAWTPWVIALILWLYYGLEYLMSDFAITNKRILMREGFFYRHTNEMRLAAISQVNVLQSLLGQLLNYGTVSINAFGAFDSFTIIAKPYRFQKSVNEYLDKRVR